MTRLPRELLPAPLLSAGPGFSNAHALATKSRAVRSRFRRSVHAEEWANAGVSILNELIGQQLTPDDTVSSSMGQRAPLEEIRQAYQAVRPPACTDAAAAFNVLCGSRTGYAYPRPWRAMAGDFPCPFRSWASTPPTRRGCSPGRIQMHGSVGRSVLLRSPTEFQNAQEKAGDVRPHNRPRFGASLEGVRAVPQGHEGPRAPPLRPWPEQYSSVSS